MKQSKNKNEQKAKVGTDEPQSNEKLYNYTLEDLVEFGEFLLSDLREEYLQPGADEKDRKRVYHSDVENWKQLKK